MIDRLRKYNQQHLLNYAKDLSEEEYKNLIEEIEAIDFDLVTKLYKDTKNSAELLNADKGEITPLPCVDKASMSKEEYNNYYNLGISLMKQGKYAALTMAGGQGTRLGYSGPKGSYFLGEPINKSLFQIQCQRLAARNKELGCIIPWYIMTSRENDLQTKQFFRDNDYFGYDKNSIMFFKQGFLPMLLEDGRIVMTDKKTIKQGADGHGGVFKAAIDSGAVADMKRRGVEWIFVGGIDNILVRLDDPLFVGYLAANNFRLGGKSLIKRDPYEKAGVFCKRGGRPCVIEYTEISDEMAHATDEQGKYLYGDLHILCNMFNIGVFDDMANCGLPYHVAHKKTDYIDEHGNLIKPDAPNAYKYEAFMFDAFEYYENMGILRVKREEEFAPIKNKEGQDSPQSATELYIACEINQ